MTIEGMDLAASGEYYSIKTQTGISIFTREHIAGIVAVDSIKKKATASSDTLPGQA
jgi:hypothetical protein